MRRGKIRSAGGKSRYAPRIEHGPTAGTDELIDLLASWTGLNRGEVLMVLYELSEAVEFLNSMGRGVRLEGLGIYTPNLKLDGTIHISHRTDPGLKRALNQKAVFTGKIRNRRNIGRTPDELVALWNAAHPDDPVVD